jgi:hypothetical protein
LCPYCFMKTVEEDPNPWAGMIDLGTPCPRAMEKASVRLSCPLPCSAFARAVMALASRYDPLLRKGRMGSGGETCGLWAGPL